MRGDDGKSVARLASSRGDHDAAYWVERVAKSAEGIKRLVVARLVRRKILAEPGEDGALAFTRRVARSKSYPSPDGTVREDVRLRLMRLLFSDELPDPEDIVLICLADASGVFRRILTPRELNEVQERIALLGRMDLIGQAVSRLIQTFWRIRPELKALHEELPEARGLPLIGNALDLKRGVRQFFTKQYLKLGPVFRVRVISKRFVTLAGRQANLFMQQRERFCLQTGDIWEGFRKEMGASRFLLGMDGAEHFRMRRELRDGFSSSTLTSNLPQAVESVRRHIHGWGLNRPQPGFHAFQRIVADQLGLLAASTIPDAYTDDLIHVFKKIVLNCVIWRNRFPWRTRRYRRDLARVRRLCRIVLRRHQLRRGQDSDLIDAGLALHRSDPLFLPEIDLPLWALTPFIAGIDTSASAIAFMLYAVLKHPDLKDRMREEADELFRAGERGMPTLDGIRELDVTKRVAMETLRMHPVVPALRRTAACSFEFNGHRIPAGEDLFIANAVPHYLPQFFPEPERFDIDRYLPGRDEHKQPGAFAPYGLGAHRCLGANLANVQLPLIIATLLHEAEVELQPADYQLKTVAAPFQSPDGKFRFRVVRRRRSQGVLPSTQSKVGLP